MRVKFKLKRKAYIHLINWIARLDQSSFRELNSIDGLNIRALYIDALNKHERWRTDKNYSLKEFSLQMEVNHYGTLKKIFDELYSEEHSVYEKALLTTICNSAEKQIEHEFFINQNLIML